MFIRADAGVQYISYSQDDGYSWTPAGRSNIPSPLSPASIKRIPATGDLLMAWNNNNGDMEGIMGKGRLLRLPSVRMMGKIGSCQKMWRMIQMDGIVTPPLNLWVTIYYWHIVLVIEKKIMGWQ